MRRPLLYRLSFPHGLVFAVLAVATFLYAAGLLKLPA